MSDEVKFDWHRQDRTGIPEVVFAEGKTVGQIVSILDGAAERNRSLLITRLSPELCHVVRQQVEAGFDYDEMSRTAIFGAPERSSADPAQIGSVGIVCAGSSDLAVAREAQRSLDYFGVHNALHADVGVAGLWRLLDIADDLKQHSVLIAVAGMEGALFSVVAGLVPGLVIAVPTSVGYGVATGGQAALTSALASCAPGIVCVNIDNGFGAAAAARKVLLNGAIG